MMAVMKDHSMPRSRKVMKKVPALIYVDNSECSSSSDDETISLQAEGSYTHAHPLVKSNQSCEMINVSFSKEKRVNKWLEWYFPLFVTAGFITCAGEVLVNDFFPKNTVQNVLEHSLYFCTNLLPLYIFMILLLLCCLGITYQKRSLQISRIFRIHGSNSLPSPSDDANKNIKTYTNTKSKSNICGSYRLIKSINKDPFLDAVGLSWTKRKLLAYLHDLTMTISHDDSKKYDIILHGVCRFFPKFSYHLSFNKESPDLCAQNPSTCEDLISGGIMLKFLDKKNGNIINAKLEVSKLGDGHVTKMRQILHIEMTLVSSIRVTSEAKFHLDNLF